MKKQFTILTRLIIVSVLLLLPILINPVSVSASGKGKEAILASNRSENSTILITGSEMGPVSAGWYHTCALTTVGGVMCWGQGNLLGNDPASNSYIPVNVSALPSGVSAITAGEQKTCVLTSTGGAKCWGSNFLGQLGNNSSGYSLIPVDVWGLSSGVSAIAVGDWHACALTTLGGVKCWGGNFKGELGNNSTIESNVPVDVTGLSSGVSAIAAGGEHTCALTTTGGVKCWGQNSSGQLGNNSTHDSTHPVDVSGLSSGVSAIAAGTYNTCALTTTGGVKCWGWGSSGQLGNNAWESSLIPMDVSGLSNGVSAIAVGSYHACALTTTGGVKCWGSGYYGQLGNNAKTNRNIPVDVSGLSSGVSDITAGFEHTCAFTTAGWVECWGFNYNGQLGNNSTTDSPIPVNVIGFGPIKQSLTFKSDGAQDGWILESTETSGTGGTLNSIATTLRLGDDTLNKQYRSILSFNTSSLPNNAVITKVTLKVKYQGITGGGTPITTFQGIMVDIKKGFFGTADLQASDFQTAASKSSGAFKPTPVSNWYSLNLTSSKANINKFTTNGGLTQIRLRFQLDDDNNAVANYLSLYSGDAGSASKPQLIIEYYTP